MMGMTMIPIPPELLEQVERGNVLLFIGERIVCDAEGRDILDTLAAHLAERIAFPDTESSSFPEIAQAYQDEKGRQALIQFVREQIEANTQPQSVHSLIARLSACNLLVTTCFDQRIERSFAAADRPLDIIISNEDVAFEDERRARLYKLRGSAERPESLALTEDDYEEFFEAQDSISVVLQGYLARKTVLFVGYDLDDPHFKRLYRKVTAPLDDYARRSYAFGEAPPPQVARWCKRHSIDVVPADAHMFLQSLIEQLAARTRPTLVDSRSSNAIPAAPLPSRPYKLLDYYEPDDAAIFFGRAQETQTLVSLIHGHRLTLLYGASGVGKTSLLLAGAGPRFQAADPPYELVYARALEDPAQVIRRVLRRRLPDAALPMEGALVDFLAAASRALDRPVVLALDQFEEFFIRLSPQFRAAFIDELGALYDARDVPVKIVISLREDWLAAINELEARIPEVFRTRMRALPLTREQARLAIMAPAEQFGVAYEPALVERLLVDLPGSDGADVLPPQLQLVCSALYAGLASGERTITLAAYERVGGARGVLQQYLADELARLGRDERALARGALEELVTSQGTKAVKSVEDVARTLDVAATALAPVLEKLVRARLLRALEQEDGAVAYELAHEYLIREIGLSAEAQTRKQAEELVRQEVENWQRFGTLLAADKLALINASRALLRLDDDARELLLRSALDVGEDVEYWIERIGDPTRRAQILAERAQAKRAVVRVRVAQALGAQDAPESVEPLLYQAINDSDVMARTAARASLAKLVDQRQNALTRICTALEDQQLSAQRSALLETLSAFPLTGLPSHLHAQVLATRARLRFAVAAEWTFATPLRRALVITSALLLGIIVCLYSLSVNSYYLDTESSRIVGGPNSIVIRQGIPGLQLPGMGQGVVADSGISDTDLSPEGRNRINQGAVAGLWVQRHEGYHKWGRDVTSVLKPPDRMRTIWYLNRREVVADLLMQLRSTQGEARREWVQMLEQALAVEPELATPEVVAVLVDLLSDDDLLLRAFAASALGHVSELPAAAAAQLNRTLEALTQAQATDVRTQVAYALAQVGMDSPKAATQVVVPLISLLQDSEESVVSAAATALSQIALVGPDNAEQVVTTTLELIDGNSAVLSVIGSIGAGDSATVERAMQTTINWMAANPHVDKWGIIDGLGSIVTFVPEQLPQRLRLLVQMCAAQEEMVCEQVSEATRSIWNNTYNDSNLWRKREQIQHALMQSLQSDDADQRATAALMLSYTDPWSDQAAFADLLSLLDSQHPNARDGAARTLRYLTAKNLSFVQPHIFERLIQITSDSNPEVRASVAYMWGEMLYTSPELTTEASQALLALLSDPSAEVRAAATQGLGRAQLRHMSGWEPHIQDDSVWQAGTLALITALSDTDAAVRADAATSLGQLAPIADTDSITNITEALVITLRDTNVEVSQAAADALGQFWADDDQIGKTLVQMLKETSLPARAGAAKALQRVFIYDEATRLAAVTALSDALQDPEPGLRAEAALALGVTVRFTDEMTQTASLLVPALIDEHPTVRLNAATALSDGFKGTMVGLVTPETLAVVTADLSSNDTDRQRSAMMALSVLGVDNPAIITPAITSRLQTLLGDPQISTRSAAALTFGKLATVLPDTATVELFDVIFELVRAGETTATFDMWSSITEAVIKANPTIATREKAQQLMTIQPYSYNIDFVLAKMAAANPEVREYLLTQLETSNDASSNYKIYAIFSQIGATTPEHARVIVTRLITLTTTLPAIPPQETAGILASIAVANPEVAPQVADVLVQYLADQTIPGREWIPLLLQDVSAADRTTQNTIVTALIQALEDSNDSVRSEAGRSLGAMAIHDPTIIGQISALVEHPNRYVRAQAANAMGQVLIVGVISAANTELMSTMTVSESLIRNELRAAEVITRLITLQNDRDDDVQVAVATALGRTQHVSSALAAQAADALVTLLADSSSSVGVTAAFALRELVKNNPDVAQQVTDTLIRRADDPDRHIRYFVTGALRQMVEAHPSTAPQVISAIGRRLEDPDARVRFQAVNTLDGAIHARRAVATPELVEQLARLKTDVEPQVRINIGDALRSIGISSPDLAPQVVAALVELLGDEQSGVGDNAADALQTVIVANRAQAPAVVQLLIGKLTSDDARLRLFAAGALRQVAEANTTVASSIVPELIPLLDDPNERVRLGTVVALNGLVDIDPKLATPALADALIERLNDPSPEVVSSVPDTLSELVAANPSLASKALQAITGRMSGANALQPNITQAALGAISSYREAATPEAVAALLQLESEPTYEVREIALNGLERMIRHNPALVTPALTSDILRRVDTTPTNIKFVEVAALEQIGLANPASAQQIAETLTAWLSRADNSNSEKTGQAIQHIILAHPQAGAEIEQTLDDLIINENAGIRTQATNVLAHVYAVRVTDIDDTNALFLALQDARKAVQRPIAARALFLAGLRVPALRTSIMERLEPLAQSAEPHIRIEANRALQMLMLTDTLLPGDDTAASSNRSVSRAYILSRFAVQETTGSILDESPVLLFDEQMTWAATQTVAWMNRDTTTELDMP
jgi:HEAT repeat protein